MTMVNGCTKATAQNMKGMASVDISAVSSWVIGHQACIIVDTNTAVTWNGNLNAHPVVGGESPTADANSVITQTAGNANSKTVTFAAAGDYPYICGIHVTSMKGVIYVE